MIRLRQKARSARQIHSAINKPITPHTPAHYQFSEKNQITGAPKKFCSAPWSGGIFRITGELVPCGFSNESYGNWKKEGVIAAWNSAKAQHFRKSIANGEFPCSDCERCFKNRNYSHTKIMHPIMGAYSNHMEELAEMAGCDDALLTPLWALRETFVYSSSNAKTEETLEMYFRGIDTLVSSFSNTGEESVVKKLGNLKTIGRVFESYFRNDLTPPVAPSRQVMLIAICNIACIHCPGLFTGSIKHGVAHEGQRLKQLDLSEAMYALEQPEDIVSFYMNGSEFLLYQHWKKVCDVLTTHGVKISLSTNGMLFTPTNTKKLLECQIARQINISLDGGTRETIERIRDGVNYDKLIRNTRLLIEMSQKVRYRYRLTFSFVLMKSNYKELPQVVKLLSNLRSPNRLPIIELSIRPLCVFYAPEYLKLLKKEHPTLIDKDKLEHAFLTLQTQAKKHSIVVNVLGFSRTLVDPSLDLFIENGMQLPPPPQILQQTTVS